MEDDRTHNQDPHHHAMHDLGGTDHQPFLISEHEPDAFDKDVDALVNLLALRECGLVRPDECMSRQRACHGLHSHPAAWRPGPN